MLRVVTGPFHPGLQTALVEQLRQAKADDPLAPVAILVPSSPLVHHLQRVLTVEAGLSLLNVRIWTFHQLALRLSEECDPTDGSRFTLKVVDPLFFEQLIRHLLQRGARGFEPFRSLGRSSGTWAGLWATVRDLKDAMVDEQEALRAIEEGCFDAEDAAWLRALFTLYGAVEQVRRALRVGTPDDLAAALLPRIPSSPFLGSLHRLFYYGFYDLTQVQLAFFEAVTRRVPATLFFPLTGDPREKFARKFFERYVQPIVAHPGDVQRVSTPAGARTTAIPSEPSIRSVVGVAEELASACRQILELVETNGYRFEEIGVVARTLEPYRLDLAGAFDRHRIPFRCSVGRPLIHEPLCKTVLQLASLPLNDGYWTSVLDVVSSPLYRSPRHDEAPQEVRPDLWRLVVPALHIVRGREDWGRLLPVDGAGTGSGPGDDERLSAAPVEIPVATRELLYHLVSDLLEDCSALPTEGRLARMVAACRTLVARYLPRRNPSDARRAGGGDDPLDPAWEAIDGALASVEALEPIAESVTWAEFVELLTHACERATLPVAAGEHGGVLVLDAMAARGISFKALFLLGMNEQVFPRAIREDAFLRDRHRRVLEATVGFKIDEKLSGYDEEALLFAHLGRAAGRRWFLSYQRADEDGRALAPSSYLAEVAHAAVGEPLPVQVIPRRFAERVAQSPHLRRFLPLHDLLQWAILHKQDPDLLLAAVGQETALFRRASEALLVLEDEEPGLTTFDGRAGTIDPQWTRVRHRGVAPTSLQRYAQCPFRYFSADVLGLSSVRREASHDVDPALLGILCHGALRACYSDLIASGWPAVSVPDDDLAARIHQAVEEGAMACERQRHTGHALLWDMAKQEIRRLVAALVRDDEREAREQGYVPVAFEVEADGRLPVWGEEADGALKIHGRVDRIDRHRDTGQVRVVDYKLKLGPELPSEDHALERSAVRGLRLQPPFYTRLEFSDLAAPFEAQFIFLGPRWSPPIARRSFQRDAWATETGRRLRETIRLLVEGVRAGLFPIVPGSYCETCEFWAICRRTHTPSNWRAAHSPEVGSLRSIRRARVEGAE